MDHKESTSGQVEAIKVDKILKNVKLGTTDIDQDEMARKLAAYVPGTDAEKKLVRKIDMYLLPMLFIMYIMNYVDRTNIGNAKIAGMDKDLDLSDEDYTWVVSIFFISYLLFEVPSNMLLSRSRVSIFLPTIMLVWGALSAVMAVSKNKGTLLAFRFILGAVESGFFPGVLFVLSSWYKKAELGKRFAIFYSAAILSGAFGGLLAGGITGHMDNAHGIRGWRWLFIIEGVATVGISFFAYVVLLDYPATTKKFSQEERDLAVVRLLHDGMGTDKGIASEEKLGHWGSFKAAVTDWRTGAFTILFMLLVGSGTISYFIPTITKSLGYNTITAQYMTIPIYLVATVGTNVVAFSADKNRERRWHVAGSLGVGFVAGLVCVLVHNPKVRYAMVCFLAAGIWSALPTCLAWVSNTISLPAEKRAIVLAIVNACGNFSSVYGSRLWPSHTAPSYTLGFGVTTAFLGAGAVLAALLPIAFAHIPVRLTDIEKRAMALRERANSDAKRVDENEV